MSYKSMKKLIENQNLLLAKGAISEAEYTIWKVSAMNKLDVFLAFNRLTEEQYEELVGMLQ